jgi:hypothetical protein
MGSDGGFFDQSEEKDIPETRLVEIHPYLEIAAWIFFYIAPFIYICVARNLGTPAISSVTIGWATYGASSIWMLIVVFPSLFIWLGISFYFFCGDRNFRLIHAGYFGTITLVGLYYTFFP